MVRGEHEITQEYYLSIPKVAMKPITLGATPRHEMNGGDMTRQDPRLEAESERRNPTKDMKEVQIRPLNHKVTKMGTSFSEPEEVDLISLLRKNIDLSVLVPWDMPEIYTIMTCYRLNIDPSAIPVSQRKCKVCKEKKTT